MPIGDFIHANRTKGVGDASYQAYAEFAAVLNCPRLFAERNLSAKEISNLIRAAVQDVWRSHGTDQGTVPMPVRI